MLVLHCIHPKKKSEPIGVFYSETAASTLTDSPPKKYPKLKKSRCTSVKKQQIQKNKLKMEVHRKIPQKKETIHYKSRKDKVFGISAKQVSELVKNSHGIVIPAQKIQHAVAEVTAGALPRERGNTGSIPGFNFNHLKISFESYMKIKQINGNGNGK